MVKVLVPLLLVGCHRVFGVDPGPGPGPGADAAEIDAQPLMPTAIVAGGAHNCLTRVDGATRCWGDGTDGRLGYGNTTTIGDNELAGAGGDLQLGGLSRLSLGDAHTCALETETGSVRCWGNNVDGRLGTASVMTIGDNETLSTIPPIALGGPAVQVVTGATHTCAILVGGAIRCWGSGQAGRLGLGAINNIGDNETPSTTLPVALAGEATILAAGAGHTCALLATSGAVQCWGLNNLGQLGYGNLSNLGDNETVNSVPAIAIGAPIERLTVGAAHTCVLLAGNRVRCWGRATEGQLGYGNTMNLGDNEEPSPNNVDVGGTVLELAAGGSHTCALLDTRRVRCWGSNTFGQLGYGHTSAIGDGELPSSAGDVALGEDAIAIAAGADHTCALLASGTVRCWGRGDRGQLGYGTTENVGDNEVPADVPELQIF